MYTVEHRKNISIATIGKKKPDGFRIGVTNSDETKQKQSNSKLGLLNPSVNPKTIYNDKHEPIVTILLNFTEVCTNLGFPTSLLDTYKNNNSLYDLPNMRSCDVSKLKNNGNCQFKGWYIRLANK